MQCVTTCTMNVRSWRILDMAFVVQWYSENILHDIVSSCVARDMIVWETYLVRLVALCTHHTSPVKYSTASIIELFAYSILSFTEALTVMVFIKKYITGQEFVIHHSIGKRRRENWIWNFLNSSPPPLTSSLLTRHSTQPTKLTKLTELFCSGDIRDEIRHFSGAQTLLGKDQMTTHSGG